MNFAAAELRLTCSTSYSLPGHVLLTVPTLPAGVEGRVRVVKELRLLMEGKSEYFDDAGELLSPPLGTRV